MKSVCKPWEYSVSALLYCLHVSCLPIGKEEQKVCRRCLGILEGWVQKMILYHCVYLMWEETLVTRFGWLKWEERTPA